MTERNVAPFHKKMVPVALPESMSDLTELHYLAAIIKAEYTNLSIFHKYSSMNCKVAEKQNNVAALQI